MTYDQELQTIREASAAFRTITAAYRAGTIGDAEFLAARQTYQDAEKRFDAAFAEKEREPAMTLETAQDVLRFAAQKAHATEDAPLVLGNVSLWMDGGNLIHWPATSQWDREAFKAALESYLSQYSEELGALVLGRK